MSFRVAASRQPAASPDRSGPSGRKPVAAAPALAQSHRRTATRGSSRSQSRTSKDGVTRATSAGAIARLIDVFLADAKAMGDRVPTSDELTRARHFLRHLESTTREDHLKSVDEVLSHAPRELLLKAKQLKEAEAFVLLAAANDTEKMRKKIEADWELVNSTDRDGHTALHAAAACNCKETVDLLIEKGAHVSIQDYEGYLALHWAAENDSLEVAETLAFHTDNLDATTAAGMRVRDFVEKLKSQDRRHAWQTALQSAEQRRRAVAEEATRRKRVFSRWTHPPGSKRSAR